jgi:hypothetical protein
MVNEKILRFDNENIYDYFSTATAQDSVSVVGKRLFDVVERQSNTLVITIGDSWTWGADLTQKKINGAHLERLSDDDYRIKNVYGNILAEKIAADFLSLGELGSGNWYIDRKLKELTHIKHRLAYDRILVVGIFTDLGRDFNSHCDIDIDYRSWLLPNIKEYKDYYDFLKYINHQIALSISKTMSDFDERYQFFFSTNFVNPIGYDLLQDHFLPKTWLEIICKKNQIDYCPEKCYMVFPYVIEKLEAIFDMAPELDKSIWLKWINEIVEDANMRAAVCFRDNINFGPLLHPSAQNHACWAEYLYKNIYDKI